MMMRRFAPVLIAVLCVVTILGAARVAKADSLSPSMAAQAGTTGSLSVDVANDTAVAHSYDVTATGLPSGMTASFVIDGPVVATVKIDAKSSAVLTLRVAIPAETTPGLFGGTVTARRDDGTMLQIPFTVAVDDRFALAVTSVTRNVTAFSGQSFTFDVTVANTGAAPVTGVTPQLEMPGKWVPAIEPAVIASVDPGKDATFHVTVTVPASQVAIKQSISVSVAADQVASPASTLEVRVQSNPAYLPAAIAVALLSVIGVAVYFKRKGRR